MIIDLDRILEKIFPNAADWYELNDELGGEETSRILKNADVLMWDDDAPTIAVTVSYGTYITTLKIVEKGDMPLPEVIRYIGSQLSNEMMRDDDGDHMEWYNRGNKITIVANDGYRFSYE